MARGGQGLVRVAVVVRAGAAPLWWAGVFAAGVGLLVPGITGRRIGVMAGAALFIVAAAVVSYGRRRRYTALGPAVVRAGKHDVLQDRAVGVRNWRRGHRWWLLLAWLLALGCNFAVPVAGGLLLAGCGSGSVARRPPPDRPGLGRRARPEAVLWVARRRRPASGPAPGSGPGRRGGHGLSARAGGVRRPSRQAAAPAAGRIGAPDLTRGAGRLTRTRLRRGAGLRPGPCRRPRCRAPDRWRVDERDTGGALDGGQRADDAWFRRRPRRFPQHGGTRHRGC
ncbi:hypothetical protein [Streptomyces shaanxiensis]